MSNSVEIEYKTLLKKSEYLNFFNCLNFSENEVFLQENIYFDTADFQLKKQNMGLRIRKFADSAEATLKVPQEVGLLEITDKLPLSEAEEAIAADRFPNVPNIKKQLTRSEISLDQLTIIAQLKTKRGEKQIQLGLIALDENWYGPAHDYELELEVQDSGTDKQTFLDFLAEHDVPYRPSENKIRRALRVFQD